MNRRAESQKKDLWCRSAGEHGPRGDAESGVSVFPEKISGVCFFEQTPGFIAGYLEKKDYEYAFHMGIASGSASAFSEQLATRAEVEALLKTIHSAG